MAYVEEMSKLVCRVVVQIGTTVSGGIKTANVNFPTVSQTGYTAETFVALATLLAPILAESVYVNQAVTTFSVYNDE